MTYHEIIEKYFAHGALLKEIDEELSRAEEKFPPFHSPHEGYAVIAEELDEFWEEVKSKDAERFIRMKKELIQVAAMALRAIGDLKL